MNLKKTSIILFFAIFSIQSSFQSAFASKISLGSIIVDFKDDKTKFIDVPVYNGNNDGKKAYVKVSVFEVLNPGTDKEKRVATQKGQTQSLIVSPQKLVIPYEGQQNIRFVSLLKNLKEDKIFRVKVEPVIGKVSSSAKQAVKVLIAYETLVMVRPANPLPIIDGNRDGKKLKLKNTGNTNTVIKEIRQCPSGALKDSDKCKEVPGTRLYAGNIKEFDLPYDNEVDVTFDVNGKDEIKTF